MIALPEAPTQPDDELEAATTTMLDLFAGAGGMTAGFKSAGFTPIFAVEFEPAAARTYSANFGAHVVAGRIEEVASFPEADVIIGGPPCQGFSPLGRDRDDHSRRGLNELWKEYLRAVRQTQPKVFVIENVPEFLKSASSRPSSKRSRRTNGLSDYVVESGVLNAADYGVPQRRRRGS